MTKWEYVTVPLMIHATKAILDQWGEDGWELVQVVPGPNPENLVAYMKRVVEGFDASEDAFKIMKWAGTESVPAHFI